MAAGAAPENHILQLTADSGLDLTAIDGSGIQHNGVHFAIHRNQLVQTGVNGAGIDLHRAVVDDAVKARIDGGNSRKNTRFHIKRRPRSRLNRNQLIINIIQTRKIRSKQVNLILSQIQHVIDTINHIPHQTTHFNHQIVLVKISAPQAVNGLNLGKRKVNQAIQSIQLSPGITGRSWVINGSSILFRSLSFTCGRRSSRRNSGRRRIVVLALSAI